MHCYEIRHSFCCCRLAYGSYSPYKIFYGIKIVQIRQFHRISVNCKEMGKARTSYNYLEKTSREKEIYFLHWVDSGYFDSPRAQAQLMYGVWLQVTHLVVELSLNYLVSLTKTEKWLPEERNPVAYLAVNIHKYTWLLMTDSSTIPIFLMYFVSS